MSSSVNSLWCEELRDWDFDRLGSSSSCSLSRGSETARLDKIGVGTIMGADGGGLRGGGPEDSGSVARKKSSEEPALLFFKYK